MRRLAVASASLLAMAAGVTVVVQHPGAPASLASAKLSFGDAAYHGASPAGVREGSVRGNIMPKYTPPGGAIDEYGLKAAKGQMELAQLSAKEQALAFGDVAKVAKGSGSAAREGSVRHGVKPDFEKPLGDLGEVGLAKKAGAAGIKPMAMLSKTQALAFGDATMTKDSDAASREGSVRHGVKPDFVKPLGNLGQTGLAASPLKHQQQQLAFGDAAFHSSAAVSAREGSVRGNVKPDFKKPLGDLGETGLAAVRGGKKMSAAAARGAMNNYYTQQAKALKPSSQPELSSKAAVSQLSSYFSNIAKHDEQEHSTQLQKAITNEKSLRGEIGKYYTKLEAKDASLHTAAVNQEHAQDAAIAARLTVETHKAHAASKTPTGAAKKLSAAVDAVHKAAVDGAHKVGPKPEASVQAKARAQQLVDTPIAAKLSNMAFSDDGEEGNRHGFHSHSMARNPNIKKEIAEARRIAQTDVNDAME